MFKLFEPITQKKEVPRNLKWIFTSLFVIIYLIFLNMPLFGLPDTSGSDPFFAFRVIMASQKGSWAEFGVFPIIYGSSIFHILVGLRIYKFDFTKEKERKTFSIVSTSLGLFFSILLSIIYPLVGVYGEIDGIHSFIITIQLLIFSTLILLFDYFLRSGYGVTSGVNLFVIISVSYAMFDGMFSLSQVRVGGFDWFRGCIIAFFQGLFIDPIDLRTPLIRPGGLPDILGFILAIVVFGLSSFIISINIKNAIPKKNHEIEKSSAIQSVYNYSNSVLMTCSIFASIFLIANIIYNSWSSVASGFRYFLVNFFGRWNTIEGTYQLEPISGLAALTTPPYDIISTNRNPWFTLGYILLAILLCIICSSLLVKTSGKKEQTILEVIEKNSEMCTIINSTLAILVGLLMGLMLGFFDALAPLGTGSGILITTCALRQIKDNI